MKLFLKPLAIVGFASILLIGPTTARSFGEMAYGVTLIGNQLIGVDTNTGLGALVGPLTGNVAPFGLSGFNNQLYTFDSTADVIRQINTATGATQATYNIGMGPVLGQGGLAFQSSTVGYITSALDPATFNYSNNLYQFNLSTGTSTLITHTADTLSAIAFSSNGTLYGLGQLDGNLYTINTANGAMTTIGNVGLSIGSTVNSLAFSSGGTLYATIDDALYSLNTSTGAATAIGDPAMGTGFASVSGLAFTNGILPSAVPEPSSLVMLALGVVGPAAFGAFRKVRARHAA